MTFPSRYAHGFVRVAACTAGVFIADPVATRWRPGVDPVSTRCRVSGPSVSVTVARVGLEWKGTRGPGSADPGHLGVPAGAVRRPADRRPLACPWPGTAIMVKLVGAFRRRGRLSVARSVLRSRAAVTGAPTTQLTASDRAPVLWTRRQHMSALRPQNRRRVVAGQGGRYPTQRHLYGLGANICRRSDLKTGAGPDSL
jgi:hypothetical protein